MADVHGDFDFHQIKEGMPVLFKVGGKWYNAEVSKMYRNGVTEFRVTDPKYVPDSLHHDRKHSVMYDSPRVNYTPDKERA